MAQREPTIASILLELAEEYDDVVAEREIYERVLHRRPSRARDPFASIRVRLRLGANEVGWVRLGEGKLMPLRVALTGLRFRVAPGPHELATGLLLRTHLFPFVSLRQNDFILKDAAGTIIPYRLDSIDVIDDLFGPFTQPAIDVGDWMHREGMFDGDTILVTIEQTAPLTLRLQCDHAPLPRSADVMRQEQELLEGIAERVTTSRSLPISAADVVLAVYARAPWRTTYAGRPWQTLVQRDPRLRLINGMLLTDRIHTNLADIVEEQNSGTWEVHDAELLAAIEALQRQLLESRREAAAQELWNGIAPRASTARVVFDTRTGEAMVVQPDPIDALQDYSEQIEERLRKGEYDYDEWGLLDDEDGLFADIGIDDDDLPLFGNLREFIAERPELLAAARRLMAALSPEEIERLHHAESAEEIQHILAARFHRMLPDNPQLFATLVPYVASETILPDFNGGPPELEDIADDESALLDEGWDEDAEAWDEDSDDQPTPNDKALAISHGLMEDFYRFLLEQGKSEATAASRAGDLWIYADFLASYYAQTLAEGNYATLDECLFFFYPRRVANSSPRGARELCTSLKQFYAFLRTKYNIDDRFAREMWRRRDQVARVVDLYEQIDADSPQFERLFVRLFAPYTV
ncbi:MAG: hypothetical protein NZ699_15690 [Roseiflexus sp.]|nr:hypothetical protein [Roseiflexus sp.]MCS7290573.1 hypothetical protein [Roseiflexus sp.]MDW8231914.1 hypothetical protein [Roseiflexaceae bacterium]